MTSSRFSKRGMVISGWALAMVFFVSMALGSNATNRIEEKRYFPAGSARYSPPRMAVYGLHIKGGEYGRVFSRMAR